MDNIKRNRNLNKRETKNLQYTRTMDYKNHFFKTEVEPALKNASTAEDMLEILHEHYHLDDQQLFCLIRNQKQMPQT